MFRRRVPLSFGWGKRCSGHERLFAVIQLFGSARSAHAGVCLFSGEWFRMRCRSLLHSLAGFHLLLVGLAYFIRGNMATALLGHYLVILGLFL